MVTQPAYAALPLVSACTGASGCVGIGFDNYGRPTGVSFQTATAAPASQVEVGGRRITGVSCGAAPTDAVNVSQLLGTANNLAATLGGSFSAAGAYTPPTYTTAAGTTATTVQGALANETAATTQLGNAAAANVGAGATYTPATGVLSAPSFSVANISATGAVGAPAVATDTGTAVAGLNTDVINLANGLTSGAIGLVQQTAAAAPITVGATTGGASVDFTGTASARRLSGVDAGVVATDAVNLGQVTAAVGTATANGVQYDAPGGMRANSVTLVGGGPGTVTVTNVAPRSLAAGSTDAVNGTQLAATNTDVTNNTTSITNLNNGTAGLVQQALAGAPITVGATTDGTSVDFTGTASARRLSGVDAGVVATDAVNLGQVGTLIGAAAMSSPLQYSHPSATTVPPPGVVSNSTTLVGLTPGAAVALHNLAAGSLSSGSTDAVNGSQLFASNAAIDAQGVIVSGLGFGVAGQLGGGVVYDPTTGALGGGTYRAGTTGGTYTTVAAALANIVTGPAGSDPSAVHYPDATHTAITLGDAGAAPVGIANVADGNIAAGSHDAVTGGQLATTNGNPGSGFVGACIGGQGAEIAFVLGVPKVFDAAHMPVVKAGVSVDARGYSASYNVGAGSTSSAARHWRRSVTTIALSLALLVTFAAASKAVADTAPSSLPGFCLFARGTDIASACAGISAVHQLDGLQKSAAAALGRQEALLKLEDETLSAQRPKLSATDFQIRLTQLEIRLHDVATARSLHEN
ncbi:MAG: hypothetical protein ACRYG4_21775 [Janthinobacterium lividum]